jgi:hypothetical protein
MILKGYFEKKNSLTLVRFATLFTFLTSQNHAFIRKKPLQISEKAKFAEFCGILRTAKAPPPA